MIRRVKLNELKSEIKTNMIPNKGLATNLYRENVQGEEKEKKFLIKSLKIINEAFRLKYVSRQWKVIKVIIVLKLNLSKIVSIKIAFPNY